LAAAAFVTLLLRANCQAIFEDLGGELPSLTRWVLALPSCVILCVFLVPGVWLLVKDALIRDVRVRQWGGVVVGWAFFGWILVLVVGLFRPLIILIERID
jgi:type II secretory pathway component PulF